MKHDAPTNEDALGLILPRRKFLLSASASATLGTATTLGFAATLAPSPTAGAIEQAARRVSQTSGGGDRHFRFAVIADTHIIDSFYKGPEGNALDTETIFQTSARLERTRGAINRLTPAVEQVFLVGDYFHDYPSADPDFYYENRTRIDNAKTITDGFRAPVHVGFGNHDYDVQKLSRETSHELFRRKLGVAPYYAITHRGYKFIHLNNFLGETWDAKSAAFNRNTGSYGTEQLEWLEAELRERKPTFLFTHYPLTAVRDVERKDFGLHPILKRHRDTIQMIVAGHWHRWIDFARTFGAQHYVCASTRYDEDAYMIVDVDTRRGTHRIANLDRVDWATHYSRPYDPPQSGQRARDRR